MKKEKKKAQSSFDIFVEHLYALNNSKFFAGIIMLIMNIGSKYITLELSKSQEDYVKYTLGRQILVFAILWMGTRDIVVALVLTCVFIVFADYLLNDNSKYYYTRKIQGYDSSLRRRWRWKNQSKGNQRCDSLAEKAHNNKTSKIKVNQKTYL